MVQEQIKIFLTAVMFYTRIPCPPWVDHSEAYLNKATAYFPVIGWIAGIWAAFCYGVSYWVFMVQELA
ncbi:MAG TPA: adenosylcobinamide-GDP ribazoletransferase, partial [Microscillaceae bacterium]|nr:adenosylcobinamide-GDP ribazoletransferase [Microscillaceae bacterium]